MGNKIFRVKTKAITLWLHDLSNDVYSVMLPWALLSTAYVSVDALPAQMMTFICNHQTKWIYRELLIVTNHFQEAWNYCMNWSLGEGKVSVLIWLIKVTRIWLIFQGAKKIIFTACRSGKLKLAFTSPDVISTSPKNLLTSRINFTVLLLFEFLIKHWSLARRAS